MHVARSPSVPAIRLGGLGAGQEGDQCGQGDEGGDGRQQPAA